MFDTKIALIVREDLAVWQKPNVVAFLATGIAGGQSGCDRRALCRSGGAPLRQDARTADARLRRGPLGTPVGARIGRGERPDGRRVYVSAMFSTRDDASNRRVFAEEDPERLELVGLAIRGAKKGVDKATKGLSLHR